jgi:hypothetical protein
MNQRRARNQAKNQKSARDDRLPGISITPQPVESFVPVRIEPPARPMPADCRAPSIVPESRAVSSRRRTSVVEIVVGNGRSLKVDECIDPSALARLVAALDRGAP